MIAIRVGLTLLVTLLTLIISLAFISQWRLGANGFHLHVRFNFLNHLSVGSPVRVAGGLDVGYVKEIYYKDLKTYVVLYIDNQLLNVLPKRQETQFAIFTQGLMGQKYVNIYIPELREGDNFYRDGDILIGIDPPSIDQMLLTFSSWFDGKNGGQVVAEILRETKLFVEGLNTIVLENRVDIRSTVVLTKEAIQKMTQQLNALIMKLNLLSDDLLQLSQASKNDIQITLQNLSLISNDLNEITKQINAGRGMAGKLIYDDQLYAELKKAAKNMRSLFKKLNQNPWQLFYRD